MNQSALEMIDEALARVPGASVVGVGDNVLDCYLFEDLAYPGGNALNVAAYTSLLLGGEASFVGIVGQDRFGDHLMAVLDGLGIDTARCRRAQGPTGMAFVELDEHGDRIFTASNRGGVQRDLRLRLAPEDLEHLAQFDRLHTSTYSGLDADLVELAQALPTSYDFSDDADNMLELAPLVDVGFISGGQLSDADVESLGDAALAAGARHIVITLGSRGSRAFTRSGRATGRVVRIEALDALGAGDAFIAGYLSALHAGADVDECLAVGAAAGARACTYRGAFGHPTPAGEEARAQMVRLARR